MTIAVESTPQTRWQNQERRSHRGKGGGHVPRYWTRERCLEALAEHVQSSSGMLPYNRAYDRLSTWSE